MDSKYVWIALGGLVVLLIPILFLVNMNYEAQEVELRNRVEAQQDVNTAYFDKMWKVLKQKAGVTEQYAQDFMDIYIPLMEGRYADGQGSLMTWIQERNPEFDVSLYQDLSRSIEAERNQFFVEQKKLRSYKQEHDVLLERPPSKYFLKNAQPIDIIIVTSASTKESFETGEENDIDLF